MIVMIDGVRYTPAILKYLPVPGKTLAETLRDLRNDRKLSLSAAAHDIGCSKSYLWELEQGSSEPTLAMAKKIAIAYSVSVDFLAAHIESAPGGEG